MAWPFSSAGAPNADSGYVAVPAAVASPPNFNGGSTFWLMGANFSNGSNQDAFVTVQDGSGNIILNATRVPAFTTIQYEWPFMPAVGVQWFVSGGGAVTGKIWGYT